MLEVYAISNYLTVATPLPQYLPYARFLLDTDLSHTAKLLYTLLLDRATLSQKNNWIDVQGRIYVVYKDYTNKFLPNDSNPTTMEVVTQTNAVKSPTDSPETTKLVYTVNDIARMLAISLRSAYNLCNSTTEFRVLRVGGSIRVPKDSFDAWLYRAA